MSPRELTLGRDDVPGEIAALAERRPPRRGAARVVAIDGRSGAGKSTLAAAVGARLAAPVVEMELMYPGWDGLEAGVDVLVGQVLTPISEGRPGSAPAWDYAANAWSPTPSTVRPAGTLVVEGVGAGDRRAAAFASVVVWLELDAGERRRRALGRDREVYRDHWDRWARQEDAMLAREHTPDRADLVVLPGPDELSPGAA